MRMNSPRGHRASNTMTNNKTSKNNGPKAKTTQGARRVTAPISSSSIVGPSKFSMQSVSEGVVRLKGHEILGQVIVPVMGSVAAVYDLNPACWSTSRLSRIAATYEKYRYESFTVRYHPYAPTTVAGTLATYVELEAEEDVAIDVVTAMNHQYAAMGPVWAGHELTYRRPSQDPTTYLLSSNGVGDRNIITQGKICCTSYAPGDGLMGYLTIEYDVTFMYPELETGYPGQQFEASSASVPVLGPNSNIIATPNWSSTGVKAAEIVINGSMNGTVNAAGNAHDFPTGSTLYTAWDGAAWLLYENLEQALALVNPLRTVAGYASIFTLRYWVRRLTKT